MGEANSTSSSHLLLPVLNNWGWEATKFSLFHVNMSIDIVIVLVFITQL